MFALKLIRKLQVNKITREFCMKSAVLPTINTIKDKTIEIEGHTLNYVQNGSGPQVLLLFPGALSSIWRSFEPQIKGLDQEQFTLVAWDPPGYGQSRPPDRKFSPGFYEYDAEIALKLMKSLGYEKFSVLGWNDGGASAIFMAASAPETISRLVLWGVSSYLIHSDVKTYDNIRDTSSWPANVKNPFLKEYDEKYLSYLYNGWCDALMEISEKNDGNICKHKLSKIICPTMILHGDKDPLVNKQQPYFLAENIQLSELHRFTNGKHSIHLKFPQKFNYLVSSFLLKS